MDVVIWDGMVNILPLYFAIAKVILIKLGSSVYFYDVYFQWILWDDLNTPSLHWHGTECNKIGKETGTEYQNIGTTFLWSTILIESRSYGFLIPSLQYQVHKYCTPNESRNSGFLSVAPMTRSQEIQYQDCWHAPRRELLWIFYIPNPPLNYFLIQQSNSSIIDKMDLQMRMPPEEPHLASWVVTFSLFLVTSDISPELLSCTNELRF